MICSIEILVHLCNYTQKNSKKTGFFGVEISWNKQSLCIQVNIMKNNYRKSVTEKGFPCYRGMFGF